jgi:small subunit ribosomal protein S21
MSLEVHSRPNESIENLLRRFKRNLKRENRFVEIRKHDFFVKPSEKRRLKKRRKKLTDGTDIEDR